MLLGRGERFEPPLKRGANGARAGDHQALHQDHQKADVAPLLAQGLVVTITDVFGDCLIEEPLIVVTLFPGDRAKLRVPWLEQRLSISIDGVAFFGTDHIGLDPLAGNAADIRELLSVDQGHQPVKGVGLTLMRRCRKQQEVRRGLCQPLAQLESGHLVGAAAQAVRFIDDDEVPAGGDQVLKPFPVVLAQLCGGPATTFIQGLDRIHRHDHLREHLPGIGGESLRVLIALLAVSRAGCRGDPFQSLDVFREHELEGFAEVEEHLADPLAHESFRGDDQCPFDQTAELKLLHNETGFDGLAQPDLVCQEIAYPVTGNGAGQGPDLVRKRNNGGFDRRE